MSTTRTLLVSVCVTLGLSSVYSCGSGGGGGGTSQISDPAVGAFWGGTRVIRWTPFGGSGRVAIDLTDGAGWSPMVGDTADDGRYTWDTSAHADGGSYRLRVRSANKPPLVSGVFTLDNTAPVVTLVSPVGGELWGGTRDIEWSTVEANPDFVDIVASDDGGASYDMVIGVSSPDDGLLSWDTSAALDGSGYRVQVMAMDKAGNQSAPVSSAADFELDNTAPVLSLTAPLGGEEWDLERTIAWNTTDVNPGSVDIELSINGGVSYDQVLAQGAPDNGGYAWSTGYAPDGNSMRVRVTATDGAGNSSLPDASPGNFTVTNLRLLDPIHYLDVNGSATIDAGDELYLLYDKDITLNGPTTADLVLPVVGDDFGVGATVSMGPELHAVLITLGTGPVLRMRGAFQEDEVSSGRPGGTDIAMSMSPDAIEEAATGRDAAPSGTKDFVPGFVAGATLAPGTEASSRGCLGDLDGDGDLDLVVGSTGGDADVRFSGDDAGGWTSEQSFGAADSQDIALGDMDGDGDLDVVVAADGANLVWTNDGAGTLADSGQLLGSADSRAVQLADFDRDGDLDAAFGNGSSQANTVWWNDGSGTLTDSGQALGLVTTSALGQGDLDGDGDVDLVAGTLGGHSRAWLNDGAGGFTAGDAVTLTDVQDLAIGDLNGDGNLDVFFAVLGQNEVVLGDGSGAFGPTWDYLGNNDHRAVCLIDLDGDGDLDAVTAKFLDSERYWINDGAALFEEDPRRGEPDDSTDVLAGNVDGDGDQDLVVINDLHAHRTYRSSKAGGQPLASLSNSGASLGMWRSGFAVSGDVNGDGSIDVLVPDLDDSVRVMLGDGAGDLTHAGSFGHADGRGGALFDADMDGNLDYLQWIGDPGTVNDVLWLGDGSGGFSAAPVALGTDTLLAGDLDRDGDEDLLVVGAAQFEVWDNDGSGGFAATGQTGSTSGLLRWAFEDLDGDGDLDLLYVRSADTQVWEGDGAGGLTLSSTIVPGGTSSALSVADYDQDGDPDLVFGTNLGLSMVRNDGGLSFLNRGISGPTGSLSQVLAIDFNEDGHADFLVIDEAVSSYYMVTGDGTDTLPAPAATVVANLVFGLTLDLDGDGDLDVYWSCDDSTTPAPVADRVDLFD